MRVLGRIKTTILKLTTMTLTLQSTGKDYFGRDTYKGFTGKYWRKFVDVEGEMHIASQDGEPSHPISKEVIITIQ